MTLITDLLVWALFSPVLQLGAVQDVLHQSEMGSIEDIDKAPVVFLKALEKCHRKIEVY